MKYGLDKSTISKICGVFACYQEINQAVLYGSRAKGNYKNGSDIDITLMGDALSLDILHRVSNDIDDLLLPYTVDLSIFTFIENEELIDHIHRVGDVLYSQNNQDNLDT